MKKIEQQIEQVQRTYEGYKKTGLIGLYDHVLLKQQVEMADSLQALLDVAKAARVLRATDRPHDLCMNNAQLEHSQILCADCKLMEALAKLDEL
jgi:DNA uptake protein ComE-like DNA-binding protein